MTRVLVVGDDALARELRDAGVEVVYADGAPDQLAHTAVQEDVDAVVLPAAHRDAVAQALADVEANDIKVFAGTTADDLLQHVR